MADEVQKPFGAKLVDGVSNAASKIGDLYTETLPLIVPGGAAAKAGQAAGQLLDDTLDYYDRGAGQFASALNAQNPTPLGVVDTTAGSTPMKVAMSAGMTEPSTLAVNSAALQKGAPITQNEIISLLDPKGPGAVPLDPIKEQGFGGSFKADGPQTIDTSAQSIYNAGGIVNPMAGSDGLHLKGIGQAENAGLLKAAAENSYYQEKANIEQQQLDKAQKLEDAFNLQYQEKMDDLTSAMKDYKDLAGQKVIPGAFLARQDTSAALSTGISVALGAMAGALNGTNQNIGLEMINKAIDKDVAAQQFNLEHETRIKGQEISNQNSLLSRMREKFGDDKSAITATKLAMISMVNDKMNAQLTQKGGAVSQAVQGQANIARAQVLRRKEELEMQLKASMAAEFEKAQMLQGKDRYNLSPEEASLLYGEKGAEKYVSGFGPARSVEDKRKFQEEYGDSKNSLDAIKTILSKDINKLSPNDRAALGTELSLLTGKMRLAVLGPGAMTEAEYDRLKEALGDPAKIITFPGTQQLKLRTVMNRLQKAQDNAVSMYFGRDRLRELKALDTSNLVKPVK